MARRPAGMEPTTIESYDEVPWFRKQWFVWVLVLFFWPPLVILALTGDLYAKANRKMLEHSDAAVWRYSGGGKAMIFAAALIFFALGAIQIGVAIAAREDSPRRSQETATAAATVDDAGDDDASEPAEEAATTSPSTEAPATTTPATSTTTTTTTTATTTTTTVPGPSAVLYQEIIELAGVDVAPGQFGTRASAIVDAFPAVPATEDADLMSASVSAEIGTGLREGEVKFNSFSIYATASTVDETVALYRAEAPLADLPERGFEPGEDDDGPFVDIEFGDFGSHPDPDIDWSVLNIRVRSIDGRTEVRSAHSVNRLLEQIPPGSVLARLADSTPLLADHAVERSEVSLFYIADTTSVMTYVQVVAPRVITDSATEIEQIAAAYEQTDEWLITDLEAERARYEMPVLPDVRGTTSIGFISDDESNISHRLTLQ